MKFFINLTAALLLSASFVLAQTQSSSPAPGKVSGSVLDEKSAPFPFVNVLLLQAKDSVLIKGLAADENGKFLFDQIHDGQYLTLVSMVGYQKEYSKVFSINKNTVNLPVTSLKTDTQSLNEVTVVAKKPFIEQQIDRTVINVENSIVSAGATALEVLERAPGVTVDQQNEQLKLRGKAGVIVQIDGKQTFLSQQELITLLRNTPSDNIEKIELITNPSAKYDAAGNSGIINIKMKRNKSYGTNGNISLVLLMPDMQGKTQRRRLITVQVKSAHLSVQEHFLTKVLTTIPFIAEYHLKTMLLILTSGLNEPTNPSIITYAPELTIMPRINQLLEYWFLHFIMISVILSDKPIPGY